MINILYSNIDAVGMVHDRSPYEEGTMWIEVNWSVEKIGFGQFVFYIKKDGSIICDDEYMGKDFAYSIWLATITSNNLEVTSGKP